MAKYLTEILKELNDDPKLADTVYKDNSYLKTIFKHAYLAEFKFNIVSGTPPYTKNAKPMGLAETNLLFEMRKFNIFIRKDLTKLKMESLFISLLEMLHEDEAEILIAIKDQKLNKLYRRLNKKFAIEKGYIEDDKFQEEITPTA